MEKRYKEIDEHKKRLNALRKSKAILYAGAYDDGWNDCEVAEKESMFLALKNFFSCFDATPNDDNWYTIKTERVKELLRNLFSYSTPKNVVKGKGLGGNPHSTLKSSPPLKIRHKLKEVFPYGKIYVPVIPKKKVRRNG